MKHLMVDIETLGNKSNSVITQIAAVQFDRETGECGKQFDILLDIQDCVDQGLEMNVDTLMWWMRQDDAARAQFQSNEQRFSLKQGLTLFREFISSCGELDGIWGNSARFDLGILSDGYDKVKMPIPWAYWQELDVRTLVSFKPEVRKNTTFKGVAHNAIDDCKHQINYCTQIWSMLNE